MSSSKKSSKTMTTAERNLLRRYLVWCYKTTKESLDRIDRKFTQLKVDEFIFAQLKANSMDKAVPRQFEEFSRYIHSKRESALQEKFSDQSGKKLSDNYQYLVGRLVAVEKSIVYFLGKAALAEIVSLYEKEMTRRILEAREER